MNMAQRLNKEVKKKRRETSEEDVRKEAKEHRDLENHARREIPMYEELCIDGIEKAVAENQLKTVVHIDGEEVQCVAQKVVERLERKGFRVQAHCGKAEPHHDGDIGFIGGGPYCEFYIGWDF